MNTTKEIKRFIIEVLKPIVFIRLTFKRESSLPCREMPVDIKKIPSIGINNNNVSSIYIYIYIVNQFSLGLSKSYYFNLY